MFSCMRAAVALTAVLMLALVQGPAGASEPIVERIYITMPDGVTLRATVVRPNDTGTYPVLIYSDPYGSGSYPFLEETQTIVERGYAFVLVSVRGTGCSGGQFEQVFSEQETSDGVEVIKWATEQPWSSGRIGLNGASYAGMNEFFIAAKHPPGLVTIAPQATIADIYRDVAYPGGIFEATFSLGWTLAIQPGESMLGPAEDLPRGDATCIANLAQQATNNWRGNAAAYVATHPEDDDWYWMHSPESVIDRVEVPVFMVDTWQDNQVGIRGLRLYDMIHTPKKLSVSNGPHVFTPKLIYEQQLAWFDYWLRGVDNGVMDEPAVTLLSETDTATREERTVVRADEWPPAEAQFTPLYLREGGMLSYEPPAGPESPDVYTLPGPAHPGTFLNGIPPVGNLRYETPPLTADTVVAGPAEMILHASTTAPDTDWFVAVSEVDPNGNITYVQKGMLRASHRAYDPARSLPGRPYHYHTNPTFVTPGDVIEYRVEILPFSHPFRAGSRIRLDFLTPSIVPEPYWGYVPAPFPSLNIVEHSASTPSRLLLPIMSGAVQLGPRPACGSLAGQPCIQGISIDGAG